MPTRLQARVIVLCSGTFWACIAFMVIQSSRGVTKSPLVIVPFAIAMVAALVLWAVIAFRIDGFKLGPYIPAVAKPWWIRECLTATEWNPWLVGGVLAALLVADFALMFALGPHLPQQNP